MSVDFTLPWAQGMESIPLGGGYIPAYPGAYPGMEHPRGGQCCVWGGGGGIHGLTLIDSCTKASKRTNVLCLPLCLAGTEAGSTDGAMPAEAMERLWLLSENGLPQMLPLLAATSVEHRGAQR